MSFNKNTVREAVEEAAKAALEEVKISGTATGGSATTLVDTSSAFNTDLTGANLIIKSATDGTQKVTKITSNNATTLNFASGYPVVAGDTYIVEASGGSSGGNVTETNSEAILTAQGVSGTGITQPTGGSGILGWLSGIYNSLITLISNGRLGTSIQESYFAYLLRSGRAREVTNPVTAVNGTNVVTVIRDLTPDTVFFPTRLTVRSDKLAHGYISIASGIASEDAFTYYFDFAADATSTDPNKAVFNLADIPIGTRVLPTGYIRATTTATSATITFKVQGVESAYNG